VSTFVTKYWTVASINVKKYVMKDLANHVKSHLKESDFALAGEKKLRLY